MRSGRDGGKERSRRAKVPKFRLGCGVLSPANGTGFSRPHAFACFTAHSARGYRLRFLIARKLQQSKKLRSTNNSDQAQTTTKKSIGVIQKAPCPKSVDNMSTLLATFARTRNYIQFSPNYEEEPYQSLTHACERGPPGQRRTQRCFRSRSHPCPRK